MTFLTAGDFLLFFNFWMLRGEEGSRIEGGENEEQNICLNRFWSLIKEKSTQWYIPEYQKEHATGTTCARSRKICKRLHSHQCRVHRDRKPSFPVCKQWLHLPGPWSETARAPRAVQIASYRRKGRPRLQQDQRRRIRIQQGKRKRPLMPGHPLTSPRL